MSTSVGGQQRTYLIERPNAPGPKPTIIMPHGHGGNAAMAGATGLARLPGRRISSPSSPTAWRISGTSLPLAAPRRPSWMKARGGGRPATTSPSSRRAGRRSGPARHLDPGGFIWRASPWRRDDLADGLRGARPIVRRGGGDLHSMSEPVGQDCARASRCRRHAARHRGSHRAYGGGIGAGTSSRSGGGAHHRVLPQARAAPTDRPRRSCRRPSRRPAARPGRCGRNARAAPSSWSASRAGCIACPIPHSRPSPCGPSSTTRRAVPPPSRPRRQRARPPPCRRPRRPLPKPTRSRSKDTNALRTA